MSGNITDIIVVAIIGLGIWLGAVKGVIKMALSLCSSLVAVVVAFFIQPIVLPLLKKYTGIFEQLVDIISKNINLPDLVGKVVQPAPGVEAGVGLSPQIMNLLAKKLSSSDTLGNMQMQIAHNLAGIALQIISFFVGFVIALLIFAVVGWMLSGIGKLPVIKEVNKLAGAIVGGVIGLLLIWIVMLFLNYWFSTGQQMEIYALIQNSLIAKYLYQFNFLVYYLILLQ